MNKITEKLIKLVVDNSASFQGAFNIREKRTLFQSAVH